MFVRRATYEQVLGRVNELLVVIARMEEKDKFLCTMLEERKAMLEDAKELAERQIQRADNAVDALLAKGAGVAPISPPDTTQLEYMKELIKGADDMYEEDEDEVKKIVRRMEEGDTSVMDLAGDDR